ncbi:MAG TPA: hypothetical protein VIC71_10555 [Gammaproteobacteria bacterium]|jgi:hypothetical protein
MLTWIIVVAVLVLLWGGLWSRSLELATGILVGLGLAWIAFWFLSPYLTGMEEIPIWLPPAPIAIIATLLFIKGALVWIRGNAALPKPEPDKHGH